MLFVVGGILRGAVAQACSLVGTFAGVWAGLWAFRWLGEHWTGAQPALMFLALRWIVSAVIGLAVATLLQWVGDLLGRRLASGPAAWLDRGAGGVFGAIFGLVVAALAMMVAMLAPLPGRVAAETARAWSSTPILNRAAEACSVGAGILPGGTWLQERFHRARLRAERMRADSLRAAEARQPR